MVVALLYQFHCFWMMKKEESKLCLKFFLTEVVENAMNAFFHQSNLEIYEHTVLQIEQGKLRMHLIEKYR